jgi:hypothetical protein
MQSRGTRDEPRARKVVRALAVVVACALGGPAGCLDLGCKSDSDCGKGFACVGLIGGTCERACSTNSDCSSDEFCADMEWFGSPHCEKGCRADGQCGKDLVCVEGSCTSGCHTDDQCPGNMFCAQPGIDLVPRAGTCEPGCRADAQCGAGERCVCNACIANGCRSNDDCGGGEFCPIDMPEILSCSRRTCTLLPENLTCGASACSAKAVTVLQGSLAVESMGLPPCCPEGAPGTCGLDVSSLAKSIAVSCQAPSAGAVSDATCPAVAGAFGEFSGCRRADRRCGFDSDAAGIGLGCLLAD